MQQLERDRHAGQRPVSAGMPCGNRPTALVEVGPLGAYLEEDPRFPRKNF